MGQITYQDIWLKNKAELLLIAQDNDNEANIRAIAYTRIGDVGLAKTVLLKIDKFNYIDLEADLLMQSSTSLDDFQNLLDKAKLIIRENINAVTANFILAEDAERRKNNKEALSHYFKVLDVFPLSERAFQGAVHLLLITDTANSDQALAVIKKYRFLAVARNGSSATRNYLIALTITYELLVRSRRIEGVLLLMGLLWLSILRIIPVGLYISVLVLSVISVVYFTLKKNGLARLTSLLTAFSAGIIWAGGYAIRTIIDLL